MLRTTVDLTFLLLAVTIIVVLLKDSKERVVVDTARQDIHIVKQDVEREVSSNAAYFEKRLNSADERQDSYQSSTSSRLRIIEERILNIESNNKQSQKIVNNNTLINKNKIQ